MEPVQVCKGFLDKRRDDTGNDEDLFVLTYSADMRWVGGAVVEVITPDGESAEAVSRLLRKIAEQS